MRDRFKMMNIEPASRLLHHNGNLCHLKALTPRGNPQPPYFFAPTSHLSDSWLVGWFCPTCSTNHLPPKIPLHVASPALTRMPLLGTCGLRRFAPREMSDQRVCSMAHCDRNSRWRAPLWQASVYGNDGLFLLPELVQEGQELLRLFLIWHRVVLIVKERKKERL